ncbi:MAG TPA: peroxiredoxin [Caulobacteraceae bacterium]
MPAALQPGDKAPDFALPSEEGGDIRLGDLRGRIVVLYFYPKDDTSGCTSEATAFTEAQVEFDAIGAVVVGVSKDSVKSHGKFRQKYGLSVRLGSDVDGEMIQSYGVWVEKSMYGRKYMGIERATFLIGADGAIRQIWRKVSVTGHADQVLAAARELARK